MKPVVLVVEDEPLIRLDAVDLVESAGFEALEAADAAQALAILAQRPDIRVVFTDIDMPPGIDGVRLAVLIREKWPPIRTILTSGKVLPRTGALPDDQVFFPKPYRHADVVTALHRAVG